MLPARVLAALQFMLHAVCDAIIAWTSHAWTSHALCWFVMASTSVSWNTVMCLPRGKMFVIFAVEM